MTKAAARVTLAAAFSFYRCSSSHVIPALACAEAWDLWLRLVFSVPFPLNTIKHRGFGLSHIIDKHEADINRLGFQIEDFIPIIVQYGNFNLKKSDSQKMVFESRGFRFVVAIQKDNGNTKNWLLTAFDLTQKPK